MSDFVSSGWHWYIAIISLLSIVGCAVLLKVQSTKRPAKGAKIELHGHVWDEDLSEYNNPLPRWWMWLFYITIVFGLGYLVLYPGLGSFAGAANWTSANAYQAEMKQADSQYGPLFEKYLKVDIATLSKDREANVVGQRLFLNYCTQCHGSDAGGAKGFPNLRDQDWLYGGDPLAIETTILGGRNGVMPALGAVVGGEPGIKELANYVRSLSNLKHDAKLAAAGKEKFAICSACHGPEGKGSQVVGAPNLTDNIWLYGSSEETISEGIRNGRNNQMPAQKERLGEAKVHLLAAYIYSLSEPLPVQAVAVAAPVSPPVDVAAPAAVPAPPPATAAK
jgi:cytochrome c oxidase cbb3-type subunit 3